MYYPLFENAMSDYPTETTYLLGQMKQVIANLQTL